MGVLGKLREGSDELNIVYRINGQSSPDFVVCSPEGLRGFDETIIASAGLNIDL